MDSDDELPRLIGRRVAERRAQLKLALDEMAERTGVSRAMISRIERGEVHASAVVLDRLCGGLGMNLSALFARQPEAAPLLRRDEQPVWRDPESGYLRREVAPAGTGSPVRIVEVEFPAGAEVRLGPSQHRIIDQHIWVLEGEMEIGWAGTTYALGAGDCLHLKPDSGISFCNRGKTAARYSVILTMEALI